MVFPYPSPGDPDPFCELRIWSFRALELDSSVPFNSLAGPAPGGSVHWVPPFLQDAGGMLAAVTHFGLLLFRGPSLGLPDACLRLLLLLQASEGPRSPQPCSPPGSGASGGLGSVWNAPGQQILHCCPLIHWASLGPPTKGLPHPPSLGSRLGQCRCLFFKIN